MNKKLLADVDSTKNNQDVLKVYVLPGGKMPERRSPGAEGYDVFTRALVIPDFDRILPIMRLSCWDFGDPNTRVCTISPGNIFYIGLGFVVDLGNHPDPENNWTFTVECRTSTAALQITNRTSGIPVDSDFRAEAIAMLALSSDASPISIRHHDRLVQIVFRGPEGKRFPRLKQVFSMKELSETTRGNHWNGSTGT